MLRKPQIYNITFHLITVEWACFFIATSLCNGIAMHGSQTLQMGLIICVIILIIHSIAAFVEQSATKAFEIISIISLVLLSITVFHFAPAYNTVIATSFTCISSFQYYIECILRILQCLSALYALITSIKKLKNSIEIGSTIGMAQIVTWSIFILSMSAILLCSLCLKTTLLISVYLFSFAFHNCTAAIYQKYIEDRR